MNPTKEHIITLLSQGISTSQVAAACGISDSYVSQLKADPELASLIASTDPATAGAAAAKVVKDAKFDTTLERAELMALEKIEKNLPFANMGQAMAAFRILNSARKRSDAFAAPTDQSTSITVNLTLPAAAAARYVVNTANEIVEVEGQTMITATARSLDNLLAQRAGAALQSPAVTTLNRAASMLSVVATRATSQHQLVAPTARKLPLALSADIL